MSHLILALCNARVWVLDRQVFQQVMMRTGIQKIEENVRFLKSVPLMQTLSWDLLAKIADVLEVVSIISSDIFLFAANLIDVLLFLGILSSRSIHLATGYSWRYILFNLPRGSESNSIRSGT